MSPVTKRLVRVAKARDISREASDSEHDEGRALSRNKGRELSDTLCEVLSVTFTS